MNTLERLANIEFAPLIVSRARDHYMVRLERVEVKDGACLISECGRGLTVASAAEDYMRKISGKTLVYDACGNSRREIIVL